MASHIQVGLAQAYYHFTIAPNHIFMNKFVFSFSIIFFLSATLFSQKNVPEITIKVAEKSGFLGMGKPKFVTITLSTRTIDKAPIGDSVNAGQLYYFVVKDSGGWKLDEDFVKEELVKLKIEQNSTTTPFAAVSPVYKEGEHNQLLVSCKKNFEFHKPFSFVFPIDKVNNSVVMEIPQEYWPGFSKFKKLLRDGEKAESAGKLDEEIGTYEKILRDKPLSIFPDFEPIFMKRLTCYQKLFELHSQQYQVMLANQSITTKQKITSTEEFIPKITSIAENAPLEQYQNQTTTGIVSQLVESAATVIVRTKFVRDSLNLALDEQTIRFIVLGSSAGKIDFKYKYIVESAAHAYASLNFEDTTATFLKVTVPEEFTARLQKYGLMNAYETFLRTVNNRWTAKKPMFPDGFLKNLQKDTAQFPLPYYSILKAVEDFYAKDFSSAKAEIRNVMIKSYEYNLTERIDQLRILINTIQKNISPEALQIIQLGYKAELRSENEKAVELYKDAMLLAEDYAPAAFALGKLYDKNGDSYLANNFFQKAVTADSQYYTAYRFLYTNFIKSGNFKPMIDLLTQALSFGNDFFDIHFNLGIAYNGAAQYDLAIRHYERALELNNKSIPANIQAGVSYQNLKSYAKAREYYQRAIVIDPEDQTATENLKRLDELQKKF